MRVSRLAVRCVGTDDSGVRSGLRGETQRTERRTLHGRLTVTQCDRTVVTQPCTQRSVSAVEAPRVLCVVECGAVESGKSRECARPRGRRGGRGWQRAPGSNAGSPGRIQAGTRSNLQAARSQLTARGLARARVHTCPCTSRTSCSCPLASCSSCPPPRASEARAAQSETRTRVSARAVRLHRDGRARRERQLAYGLRLEKPHARGKGRHRRC